MQSSLPPPPGSTLPPPPPRPDHKPNRWRFTRRLHILALGLAIPAGIIFGLESAGTIIALFVIIVPFEKVFRRHEQRIRRPGLRTDLTYALVTPAINFVGLMMGIAIAVLAVPVILPALALRPLVTAQPTWLLAAEAVLLTDMLIYWTHRLGHEIGFFWRFHSIHHSSERMDWIAGVRLHPFDGVIIFVPAILLTVAGFQLEVVGTVTAIQAVLGLAAHANVRWKLRPFHRIVMTPEFHHWHHANYPESIHTNYSVFLPIWDIIWGTYYMPKDRRPEIYGNDDPIPPSMPGQMLYPFHADTRKRYRFPPTWRRRFWRLMPFRRRRVTVF